MKLFHYTSREAALEHILPTGRLRFGRLPRTNDPREFVPILFPIAGFVGDDDQLTTGSPFELIDEANELLRDSVHVLCLTEGMPSQVTYARYGNGPRRARMWAQYAGNHTGVCLCFDGDRLIQAALDQLPTTPDRNLLHDRVSYAAEGEYPHTPTLVQPEAERDLRAYVESMVERNPRDLFFTKDWDWESETEYRLLLRGETKEEESIDIRDSLEAVIMGQKFHPVYEPGVYKLCQELGVEALKIQWEMGPEAIVRMLDPARRPLIRPSSQHPNQD
jgi:hypothetical protein